MIRHALSARRGRARGLAAGALLILLAGLALAPVTATRAAVAPQGTPRGTIPQSGVDPYGTNVFLEKEVEQVKVTRTLDMIAAAHIPWIKQDFPWSDIEISAKGDFTDKRNGAPKSAWDKYDFIVNQAEQRGIQIVARISFAPDWARAPGSGANDAPQNFGDLADFINALLDHFQGRVKYVQVWNEPNLAYEWKAGGKVDPAGYTDMLKTVYTAVKQKHPEAVILSAPMAITLEHIDYAGNLNELDYWTQMYQAGAKPYFDIMAANAYGLDLPPSDPPSKDKLNFRRVELLREIMVQNDDANKAIWFNEYGWNASPTTLSQDQQLRWRRVDPAVQARYTVDGIQYALDNWPWAGVFFIWYFRQVGDIQPDNAEYYFRMVNPDFTTEPVYDAVQAAAAQYNGPGAPPTATAAPAAPTDTATAAAAPPTDTAAPAAPTDTAAAAPPTATVAPAAVTATTTGVVAATPVPPAAASSGDATIWFIAGGILVLAGIAAIGLYLARRPSAS